MIDGSPCRRSDAVYEGQPSAQAAGLKRWNSFRRSMFCLMSFAAGQHSNPYLQNAKPAELCSKKSVHGKIVDAESSRVQLFAEVIQ
jgi:hypothetical protein